MIKILLGGSPCTHWSIAQKNNRETEPEGLGWELFKNYLIAKEKFKPDFFLYENNKSAAQPIKDQIAKELGVDLMYINSALVSAQNRQRFYAFNWDVEQPEDRGIVLRDILESETEEQPYEIQTIGVGYRNRRENDGKLYRRFETHGEEKANALTTVQSDSMIAEPIRIGDIGSTSQAHRVYSPDGKSVTINAGGGGQGGKTGLYATPIKVGEIGNGGQGNRIYSVDGKSVSQTATSAGIGSNTGLYATPIRVGGLPRPNGEISTSQGKRIYSVDGKSVCLSSAQSGGNGDAAAPATGLYAVPSDVEALSAEYYHGDKQGQLFGKIESKNTSNNKGQPAQGTRVYNTDCKSVCIDADSRKYIVDKCPAGSVVIGANKSAPIYEVKNGLITIKGKQYPIKLADGFYIIRKLTPIECERLQTLPDNYTAAVSNTQRYKGLGNGWTAEVIIHILDGALKDVPKDEEIVVLSMYDGIGTGRYCLDKMGFTNVKYYAYEIDKYAKQVAMSNYPDIIQMGDAFDLRHPDWTIGY